MESLPIDSDAGVESSTGVGKADDVIQPLQQAQPNWIQDGHGLRGPQRVRAEQTPVQREPMEFRLPVGRKGFGDDSGNGAGTLVVQTGPFSGGSTGTVDGVTTITFDENFFLIQDNGGGEVLVGLNTTDCDAGSGVIDGGVL